MSDSGEEDLPMWWEPGRSYFLGSRKRNGGIVSVSPVHLIIENYCCFIFPPCECRSWRHSFWEREKQKQLLSREKKCHNNHPMSCNYYWRYWLIISKAYHSKQSDDGLILVYSLFASRFPSYFYPIISVYSRAYPPRKAEQTTNKCCDCHIERPVILPQANYISRKKALSNENVWSLISSA